MNEISTPGILEDESRTIVGGVAARVFVPAGEYTQSEDDPKPLELVRVVDAAALLGISKQTIYAKIREGDRELLSAVVRVKYLSRDGKMVSRYFFKLSYVKNRMLNGSEKKQKMQEIVELSYKRYYDVFLAIEKIFIEEFGGTPHQEDKDLFVNADVVDCAIVSAVLEYVSREVQRPLTKNEEQIFKLFVNNLKVQGARYASLFLDALLDIHKDILSGTFDANTHINNGILRAEKKRLRGYDK